MTTAYIAEKGTVHNYYDWFITEENILSKDFEAYEGAIEFAKIMNDYGFDAFIVNLMVSE